MIMFDLSTLPPHLYRQMTQLQRNHPRAAAQLLKDLDRKSALLQVGDLAGLTKLVMQDRKKLMGQLDQLEIDQLKNGLTT